MELFGLQICPPFSCLPPLLVPAWLILPVVVQHPPDRHGAKCLLAGGLGEGAQEEAMSKLPEKLCLCSLLASSASPPGKEWAGRFAWCWRITSDIPGPSAPTALPPGQIAWSHPNPSGKSLELPIPAAQPWLHGCTAQQTAALGPLPSPLPPLGGCCEGQTVTVHTGTRGRGDVAPRLPPTLLCAVPGFSGEASTGGGRCGDESRAWGYPEPGREQAGAWGLHLGRDVGMCPFSIHQQKWYPQKPETPQ